MAKIKIESRLPIFSGFYQNPWLNEDSAIEREVEWLRGKLPSSWEVDSNSFDWNYTDWTSRVTEEVYKKVEEKVKEMLPDIEMKFVKLWSPQYYNYRNDEIHVDYEISQDILVKLKGMLMENEDDFILWVDENFSHRPGYVSHVSNDGYVWIDEYLEGDVDNLNRVFDQILNFLLEYVNEEHEEATFSDIQETGRIQWSLDFYVEYEGEEHSVTDIHVNDGEVHLEFENGKLISALKCTII